MVALIYVLCMLKHVLNSYFPDHFLFSLMNLDAGIFLEDRNRTFALFEKYWSIDMRDISLLSSQLAYHSQTVNNGNQTYLGMVLYC